MEMKFEKIADKVVNLMHLSTIRPHTISDGIKKSYDEASQTVKTETKGDPFRICFTMVNGETFELGYKSEVDRDAKYRTLCRALGVMP